MVALDIFIGLVLIYFLYSLLKAFDKPPSLLQEVVCMTLCLLTDYQYSKSIIKYAIK